jgi:uncharacterized protein (DUF58 family)
VTPLKSVASEIGLFLTGFAVLFFSGFLLANSILVCVSSIPILSYLIGLFITSPKVQVEKIGLPSSARLGEIIEVKVKGQVTGGPGAVVLHDEVPESFQLVEGSNYEVISKGFDDKRFTFSYKMRCTKCGAYRLATGWETRDVLGVTRRKVTVGEARQLKVFPVSPKIRRIRTPIRSTEKINPSEGIAKVGPFSTDFKEIRGYLYGDPFKIINWKASAKAAGWGKTYPLVNEYEREGKLTIWLFLDANPNLRVGTGFENTLEYGIRAAYDIAYYFLNKGYSLGVYVYNHQGKMVHSDAGKKQFIRISNALIELSPPKAGMEVYWDEGFSKAVERNRTNLVTRSPAVIIITHLTPSNCEDVLDGLGKILAYKRKKRRPNILLINVLPYDLIPKANDWEMFAGRMLDVASRSLSNRLRNLGIAVLNWNPRKASIQTMLLGTIRLR